MPRTVCAVMQHAAMQHAARYPTVPSNVAFVTLCVAANVLLCPVVVRLLLRFSRADSEHGSVGFVLNKPSPLRLSEVQLSATAQGILDTFGSQRLQLGGPVHMETLTLLHAFGGVSGAQKVSEVRRFLRWDRVQCNREYLIQDIYQIQDIYRIE